MLSRRVRVCLLVSLVLALTGCWKSSPTPDAGGDGEKEKVEKQDGAKKADKPKKPELTLSVEGQFVPGAVLTVTALVKGHKRGERLTLGLPPGFSLVRGDKEAEIPPTPKGSSGTQVTWTVKAGNAEVSQITVKSSFDVEATQTVLLSNNSLGLSTGGDLTPGGEFTVTVFVKGAKPGERLTLILPKGLSLAEGKAEKAVEVSSGRSAPVKWMVKAGGEGAYTVKVKSSEGLQGTTTVLIKKKVPIEG
jgi:hypothetical protein